MKKIVSFILAAVMCTVLALTVTAADDKRLVDNADIISAENEKIILDYLDEKSAELDFDFTVLTEQTIYGADVQDYADEYYDGHGFSSDGILLLIVMDTREWAFSTSGFGITVFGDGELGELENAMVGALSQGEYANGIANYAQGAVYFVNYAKEYGYNFSEDGYYTDYDSNGNTVHHTESVPAPIGKRILISALIGVIIAAIAVLVMKSKMNTVHKKAAASDYIREGSLDITRANDVFINSSVARTPRAQAQSRSGGSSHHGGGSIHISSGGGSHGGSHGRF